MQYLYNFYKNTIKNTKLDNIIHMPGFWIFFITTILCSIFFEDKYFFMISGAVFYILYKTNIQLEHKTKLLSIEMYDPEIPQILDKIIAEAFDEYFLYNKGFEKDKEYINGDEEKQILNTMINSVSSRLSESTLAKLEAYYNKDMVPNIISSKIYMLITAYVAQNNVPEGSSKRILDSMVVDEEAPSQPKFGPTFGDSSIRYL